ncbi:MAG: tetratricopeptide repeat protein [Lentisphaeria bacterium]|nr:tetratricopeptide repeat protein [Lentisphaeria bacterium]
MNRWISVPAVGILTGFSLVFLPLSAAETMLMQTSTIKPEAENPEDADLRAGDQAFAEQDFPVAVSFYTKYLQRAEKQQDKAAVRTAYERLLDALVMSKLPDLAEKYLTQYQNLYPGEKSLEIGMWRGDILFQRRQYRQAEELYRRLLDSMPSQDPRRLRSVFAYGQVLEKLGKWKEAAGQYEPLRHQAAGTLLGRRAFVRLALCLTTDGQPEKALRLLLENPAEQRDSETYSLLAAYINLKQSGAAAASAAWRDLLRSIREEQNPLVYLVASAYGDALTKAKDYAAAMVSYRAAFHAAADKTEIFETLNRMVDVISRTEDKLQAAKMAMSQLELFKDSLLSPAVKLRTAKLLREAGNVKGALELYETVFANMNSTPDEKFQAIYEYALLLSRTGRFAEAEKTVHSHFRGDQEAKGELLLAEILVRLKRPDDYIRKYRMIASRWKDRAVPAYEQAAAACLDAGLPDRTLEFLSELRKVSAGKGQDGPLMLYLEAAARAQKKEYAAALKLYDEFIRKADRKDPKLPEALYHSGLLAYSQRDMKLAAERLSRFRKEYPDHGLVPQASAWLIQIYTVLNDPIAAERETWLLAEQHSDSEYAVDALFRLAAHYAEEGAGDKATASLQKLAADTRFPKIQARAVYELAFQASRNGKNDEALRYLRLLYEKFPDTPVLAEGYYLNGDILRTNSDFKSAIDLFRKVVEMRPQSQLALAAQGSIGDCLLAIASQDPASAKNELLSAIQAYKTVLEQPGCPSAFESMALYRTGRCLELLGQRAAASEEYRKLLYKFPARQMADHPVETVWCVRAAEALTDIASRQPLRTTLRHARFALHWLADAGMIPLSEAAARFEKLKNNKFNP